MIHYGLFIKWLPLHVKQEYDPPLVECQSTLNRLAL